jgi:hypothetical protein
MPHKFSLPPAQVICTFGLEAELAVTLKIRIITSGRENINFFYEFETMDFVKEMKIKLRLGKI